ncbi:hypothetical protein PsYK624_170380 [Phanerochaete sordida]|uniref:Uncharacterized protein n=1 Tax=Phanerochaete sordida TaxID=48140 RepID=A0A9P3LPK7_9APHY|nr:hypothetical protein PsYK624_170380 [Phanerochaete sordida]
MLLQGHYNIVRNATLRYDPTSAMLSFDAVKRRVAEISGVFSVYHDMCIKSCVGFTGPFEDLDCCPVCSEHCYRQDELERSGKKVPVQQFLTNHMGPAIQAMWRSPKGAEAMSYRQHCTAPFSNSFKPKRSIHHPPSFPSVPEDYIHGSDYIEAVLCGDIGDNNTVLMLSFDGAQLYRNKASDIWIYIWVMMDRGQDSR